MKDGGSIDPSTVWERSNRCEVVSLTVTGTNCYDCDAITCPCPENPPKMRAQKPNSSGVWSLQKSMFRIHCFTEQVCWDLTATHAGIEHALDWLKALARGSGCRS
jgi:hypothetical protein